MRGKWQATLLRRAGPASWIRWYRETRGYGKKSKVRTAMIAVAEDRGGRYGMWMRCGSADALIADGWVVRTNPSSLKEGNQTWLLHGPRPGAEGRPHVTHSTRAVH
jgi:hypothetical protein